jgi:probable addiction module antidote protein
MDKNTLDNIRSRTTLYDSADYLNTQRDVAAYLEAALEDGDPKVITAALGNIARAKGMTQIAKETGLNRESLYSALSPEGNPTLATLLKVIHALGLQLAVKTSREPRIKATA